MTRYLHLFTALITIIHSQCDWNNDEQLNVIDVVQTLDCILNYCWDGTQCDWNEDNQLDVIDVVLTVECILNDCWNNPVYGCTDPGAINFNPEASFDDGSCDYVTGSVTDIDGNVYTTVIIGDQEWMASNLVVTHYRNGDPIPHVPGGNQWGITYTGAYCYYDNDPDFIPTYGLLYNGYAVIDERRLAPEGWQVPSAAQWRTLIDYLGGYLIAGGPLKATGIYEYGSGLWLYPNEGATNETGFSALPGGSGAWGDDPFSNINRNSFFWTSTKEDSNTVYLRNMNHDNEGVGQADWEKRHGFSIRCVRYVGEPVPGCIDDEAINFNPTATYDDGSCFYTLDEFIWETVPAGEFIFGDDGETLNLDYDFDILRYQITKAQYAGYLQDAWDQGDLSVGECFFDHQGNDCIVGYYEGDDEWAAGFYPYYSPNGDPAGLDMAAIEFDGSNFTVPAGYENHPVCWVTWIGAKAMGEYYNLRLPTEEEWEKAARGETGQWYPWGDDFPACDIAVPNGANYNDCWVGTTKVGTFYYSTSPYGLYDMAGNVWEWTETVHNYTHRVCRGGSMKDDHLGVRVFNDVSLRIPDSGNCGFRLVQVQTGQSR